MEKTRVVIWGASGHARVVVDILRLCHEYEVVGLIDDLNPQKRLSSIDGCLVLGGRDELRNLKRTGTESIVIGIGDCGARTRLAKIAVDSGFKLVTAIHPGAVVSMDAQIGIGSVVAAGAVVNPGAQIGSNCIINTACSVDHECVIGEGAHVGPGVRLGGLVMIGEMAWIGIGAIVVDRLRIGARSIIGAGAVITRDIPSDVVAYGVPGRVVRTVSEHLARIADARPRSESTR